MPILPENKKRYPANWKDIRKQILERAKNQCEFCGIENYATSKTGKRVVLTVAHLDHTPENCDHSNLKALCQKCHNKYDASHRAETRRTRTLKQKLNSFIKKREEQIRRYNKGVVPVNSPHAGMLDIIENIKDICGVEFEKGEKTNGERKNEKVL